MKRWEKYWFTALAGLMALTGTVSFWMKYMLQSDDPFAVVNHPMQPAMLDAHVLAAPAFLVLFGILFNSHVVAKLGRWIPNRRSGLVALATVALMTGSGYLLQVVTGARTRQVTLAIHIVSGSIFAVAYVVHLTVSARLWRAERAALPTQGP